MALVVPDEGEVSLLDMLVDGDGFSSVRIRLYKNNLTPDEDTVYGDMTECDFSGYAQVTPSFGAASVVSHKGKIVDSAARNFTHNGGGTSNTVYGYYVVDSTGTRLLWVERFASPITMANSGDQIQLTAAFTANSEN